MAILKPNLKHLLSDDGNKFDKPNGHKYTIIVRDGGAELLHDNITPGVYRNILKVILTNVKK